MTKDCTKHLDYINSFSHENWNFWLIHLIEIDSMTKESIDLVLFVDVPFVIDISPFMVYGYLPESRAHKLADDLDNLFEEFGYVVMLEKADEPSTQLKRIQCKEAFWKGLIEFKFEQIAEAQIKISKLADHWVGNPPGEGEMDSILDLILAKGVCGLTDAQKARLDELSKVIN